MKNSMKFAIIFILILSLVGIVTIFTLQSIPPKFIIYQSNYWDFYFPFSDIYIKEMVPSQNGSTVFLYPNSTISFSFITDGIIRIEIGDHFIECTKTENGKYITITDTDIPFMPKVNPDIWGTPIGDNNDFETMKEFFKIPRSGECDIQTNLMIKLAYDNGIISRRINLWQSPTNGILTAGGHTTMEIYDRKTKQWIWMDPLYNIIEGKIENKPITFYEFQTAIHQNRNIVIVTTDGKEIPFDQWQHNQIWKNYLNPSQIVTYVRSN